MTIQHIDRADVESALVRMEHGEADTDDANLIRAYIDRLEGVAARYVDSLASAAEFEEQSG